ncbi:MAG: CehA/McbA family metallohydrolase [Halobacteriales archaeon]
MAIEHPYDDAGEWLRGNLHTHTTESDGERPVAETIADYEDRGYDFLAISDHDTLVDPAAYRDGLDLTLLPGVEITANGSHVLHVGADRALEPHADRARVLEDVAAAAGFAVLAHPNWRSAFAHWPQERLRALDGYRGIELYNGTVERHEGSALAADRWDRLLAEGRDVLAFGTDDTHRPVDVATAWTVVRAAERTPAAILDALRAGRSYVSTGVEITGIDVDGGTVAVGTADADELRLVSDYGRLQAREAGPDAAFDLPGDLRYGSEHTYARIECLGAGGAAAWTQALWL